MDASAIWGELYDGLSGIAGKGGLVCCREVDARGAGAMVVVWERDVRCIGRKGETECVKTLCQRGRLRCGACATVYSLPIDDAGLLLIRNGYAVEVSRVAGRRDFAVLDGGRRRGSVWRGVLLSQGRGSLLPPLPAKVGSHFILGDLADGRGALHLRGGTRRGWRRRVAVGVKLAEGGAHAWGNVGDRGLRSVKGRRRARGDVAVARTLRRVCHDGRNACVGGRVGESMWVTRRRSTLTIQP